jgi:hypothetical protein
MILKQLWKIDRILPDSTTSKRGRRNLDEDTKYRR